MTTTLVDLQRDLRRIEDDGFRATGARLGVQQLPGLGRNAGRVPDQVHALDQLPARRTNLAAETIRIGAFLHLVLGDGCRFDAGATLDNRLLDERAFAVAIELVLLPGLGAGLRHLDRRFLLHGLRGTKQQRNRVVE